MHACENADVGDIWLTMPAAASVSLDVTLAHKTVNEAVTCSITSVMV